MVTYLHIAENRWSNETAAGYICTEWLYNSLHHQLGSSRGAKQ